MRRKCARCGKIELFGRSLENIGEGNLALCVECSQLLYKALDAGKSNDTETERELRDRFVQGMANSPHRHELIMWYESRAQ